MWAMTDMEKLNHHYVYIIPEGSDEWHYLKKFYWVSRAKEYVEIQRVIDNRKGDLNNYVIMYQAYEGDPEGYEVEIDA